MAMVEVVKDVDRSPLRSCFSLLLSLSPSEKMGNGFTYRRVLSCEQPLRRQSRKFSRHYC